MRLFIAAVAALLPIQAFAQQCNMSYGFTRPDDDGATSIRVWTDPGKAALFGGSLHVNTDGAKRSYKVEDFWGASDAVNNLCNAMADKCAGLDTEPKLRARRIMTEKAKAGGWQAADLAATKIDPQIIPNGPDGKPCPEKDGFLVSVTALINPAVKDVCTPQRYADSMLVPAIVLPRREKDGKPTQFETNGASVGDLVVVATADLNKVAFAVIGDTGPRRELGEGSIALAKELLSKTAEPANYREIRGKPPFTKSWDVPRTLTIVFSNSRRPGQPFFTRDEIVQAASSKFAAWGGIERLRACALIYRQ